MNEGSAANQQLIPPGEDPKQVQAISALIVPDEGPAKPVAAEPEQEVDAPEGAAPDIDADASEADTPDPDAAAVIDYDLKVPIGPGHEDATLGQLKDFFKENQDWHTERSEWSVQRIEQENEQLVVRNEMGKLVNMLGDVVPPEMLDSLRRLNQVNTAREESLLLQARPEWADPEVKAKASEKMLGTARKYGYSDAEYNGIDDHRVFKLLWDHQVLLDSAAAGKAAREKAAEVKKLDKPAPPRKDSKSVQDKKLRDAAASGNDDQKAAYISNLL